MKAVISKTIGNLDTLGATVVAALTTRRLKDLLLLCFKGAKDTVFTMQVDLSPSKDAKPLPEIEDADS